MKQNIGNFFFLEENFIGISTLPKISHCSQICDEITFSNDKYSVNQDSNFHAAPLPLFSTQPSACASLSRPLFSTSMHSEYVLMYTEMFWHFMLSSLGRQHREIETEKQTASKSSEKVEFYIKVLEIQEYHRICAIYSYKMVILYYSEINHVSRSVLQPKINPSDLKAESCWRNTVPLFHLVPFKLYPIPSASQWNHCWHVIRSSETLAAYQFTKIDLDILATLMRFWMELLSHSLMVRSATS